MRKIITGILGSAVVVSLVAGMAIAQFSSSATMTNVSFATGNADLRIWDNTTYASTWDSGINLTDMYPGYEAPPVNMWLKNNSSAPIALNLSMALTDGGANWGNTLKDNVEAYVANATDTANTGWKTLSDWNTNPASLPDGALGQGNERMYKVYFRLSPLADNDEADSTLPGVEFTLTGVQS